jgi:nitroreductase
MRENASQLLQILFDRKSIRNFKTTFIADDIAEKIVEIGQRAPSACNLQTYSVVWIKNREIREKMWSSCSVPKPIRKAPLLFVICADLRRLIKVLGYLGHDHCLKHGQGYALKLMSIIDATLVAENMTVAAECYGLGSVFIGSALANKKVIEALSLPKGVLPLTLLCVGYSDEQPPTRPRWFLKSILQTDQYRDVAEKEIETFLDHMDLVLEKEGYYQKYSFRKQAYHYRDHIKSKTIMKIPDKAESEILETMKKTGFFPGESP